MSRFGYNPERLEPVEEPMYRCPVCGAEINFDDDVYMAGHNVIGCMECISVKSAEYVMEI